ncbi:hypothetical protein H5410_028476 [Solanum commersonii]|uniref:Uncharacterized protein n=1 Tax=Solanum commersonii TaxID=4109 RepID=A0A9J5Z4X9_SOLCO|nr:hypothetical protein H5410_028476 [Solanum commersonii]
MSTSTTHRGRCFRLTLKRFDSTSVVIPLTTQLISMLQMSHLHKFKNIVLTAEEMNAIDQNILHESSSHHQAENYATLERNDVDIEAVCDKHIIDLKAYVDNSTKLIIDEISSSRSQPTQTTEKEVNCIHNLPKRKSADISNTDGQIDVGVQNSIDQIVSGVYNADVPGSSTTNPLSLNDYLDLTMTQIVQLDPILNETTTPNMQPRNRNPNKYNTSPYIRLSEGESSVRRGPVFSCIKHSFESHNGFDVDVDLINEFIKWVKFANSKAKDKFEPQMNFGVVKVSKMNWFNIMVKSRRSWEDGLI